MLLFVNSIENVSLTIMEGVKLDPSCSVLATEGRNRFAASLCQGLNGVFPSSGDILLLSRGTPVDVFSPTKT